MQPFLPLVVIVIAQLAMLAKAQTWTPNTDTAATTLVGCGVGSETAAIAAAAKSGIGAIVDVYEGDGNWKEEREVVQAGLLMDGAVSADGKTSILSSFFSIFVSTDSSASFTAVPGLGGPLQGAYMFNGNSMAAVGNLAILPSSGLPPGSVSGLAVSTDGAGEVWSAIQVMDETACRYGAFPSESTWYITAGMWNTDQSSNSTVTDGAKWHIKSNSGFGHRLTKNVHIGERSTKKVHRSVKQAPVKGKGDSATGWWGSIYKTTDAGATFTNVYNSPADALWYFNMISCGSESTCFAAAEGDNYVGLWVTTDGGANWTESWTSTEGQGLMACKMTSATDGYFAPTIKNGRAVEVPFYYTTDAGATWTLTQTLSNALVMDLDQVGTLGVATLLNTVTSQMELATVA
jgi:hypothetical protein